VSSAEELGGTGNGVVNRKEGTMPPNSGSATMVIEEGKTVKVFIVCTMLFPSG
jgi:hypothetical protein